MDSTRIKQLAADLGADLCGIATEERFSGAPDGFRPRDIYSKCRSVIVIAKRVPHECVNADVAKSRAFYSILFTFNFFLFTILHPRNMKNTAPIRHNAAHR